MSRQYDAFVSHTGQDPPAKDFAANLANAIGEKNLQCFYDEKTIRPGDKLDEEIKQGVLGCKVFIAILSPSYFKRKWCMLELCLAQKENKKLLVVNHSLPTWPKKPTEHEFRQSFENDSELPLQDWWVALKIVSNIKFIKNDGGNASVLLMKEVVQLVHWHTRTNTKRNLIIIGCIICILAGVITTCLIILLPSGSDSVSVDVKPQKAILNTLQLYNAIDLYLIDPASTSEYGDTIDDWDVSRVTNFTKAFDGYSGNARNPAASDFNEDISSWDLSSATTLENMLEGADAFNQNISRWNVSSVKNMQSMFSRASSFNQDISGWNTASVTNMNGAFSRASAFNQDLSQWNVGLVKNMYQMFGRATSFNSDLSQWNVQSVEDARWMFAGATSYNHNLCAWRDKLSVTANLGGIFGDPNSSAVFNPGPAESCPTTLDPELPNGPMCHVCDDGRGG